MSDVGEEYREHLDGLLVQAVDHANALIGAVTIDWVEDE